MTELDQFKIAYCDALSSFEMVMFSIQHAIAIMLQAHGLRTPQMNNAIIAHLTAAPLAKIYNSLVHCIIDEKSPLYKHVKLTRKHITNLIEERNILAHTILTNHLKILRRSNE